MGSLLLCTSVLCFSSVQAEERQPLFMPARDVTVVYAVQPENSSLPQKRKIYFSGNGNTFRIDGPNNMGMTIIDSAKQTATVISNKSRVYAIIPSKSGNGGLFLDDTLHYTLKGTKRVLGISCKEWAVQGPKGDSRVCITDEGVLLHQKGTDIDGIDGETTALSISYDRLPVSTFQVPLGFQQVKLPQNKGEKPALVAPNHNAQPLMPMQAQGQKEKGDTITSTEQNPFVTPQRDVDVIYAIAGSMPDLPPFHQRMRWSFEQWKQRIDSQGVDTYMVTDYHNKQLTVLNPALKIKTTTVAPVTGLGASGQRAIGKYVKVGEATVAGNQCQEWEMTDMDGNINDICYTQDGVMLRVIRNNIPVILALKVDYAHQNPALFTIPANLKEIAAAHP